MGIQLPLHGPGPDATAAFLFAALALLGLAVFAPADFGACTCQIRKVGGFGGMHLPNKEGGDRARESRVVGLEGRDVTGLAFGTLPTDIWRGASDTGARGG